MVVDASKKGGGIDYLLITLPHTGVAGTNNKRGIAVVPADDSV
jgi:hypothetical protein